MRKILLPLLMILLLAACAPAGQAPPASPTAAAAPVGSSPTLDLSAPTATPEQPPLLGQGEPQPGMYSRLGEAAYEVTLTAEDGVRLAGTVYPPAKSGASVLLLVPAVGGERGAWQPFAQQAQAAGFGVLAIDLRGQGGSQGKAAVELMHLDLSAALSWLNSLEGGAAPHIVLAGLEAGGNLALRAAPGQPALRGVAIISPLGGETLPLLDAWRLNPDLPVLVASAEADPQLPAGSKLLLDAPGLQWVSVPGEARGAALLEAHPELLERLLDWAKLLAAP